MSRAGITALRIGSSVVDLLQKWPKLYLIKKVLICDYFLILILNMEKKKLTIFVHLISILFLKSIARLVTKSHSFMDIFCIVWSLSLNFYQANINFVG